jgi:translation initiation factor IF-3
MFRGRESAHPELGKKILDRIVEQLEGVARVEAAAKLDGRNMIMVLGPDKRKPVKAAGASDEAAVEPATEVAAVPNEEQQES